MLSIRKSVAKISNALTSATDAEVGWRRVGAFHGEAVKTFPETAKEHGLPGRVFADGHRAAAYYVAAFAGRHVEYAKGS